MQQARSPRVEEAVKVVRNHEGGTRAGPWQGQPEGGLGRWEWTHGWLFGSRGEVAKFTRGDPETGQREKGTLKETPRYGGKPTKISPDQRRPASSE